MTATIFWSCATVPAPQRLVLAGGIGRVDLAVRVGLWRHPLKGPFLIDAGYGAAAATAPGRSLGLRLYHRMLGIRPIAGMGPVEYLATLGVRPDELVGVVLTHFHVDHIGQLCDFPGVPVYASGAAWMALSAMSGFGRNRNGFFAELIPADFSKRLVAVEDLPEVHLPFGLGRGFDISGDGSCLAVPLPGHALGQIGLVWPQLHTPLLYAADVQWLWRAIAEERLPGFPASLLPVDREGAARSIRLVREFARAGGGVMLAHDPEAGPHLWSRP
ncbi:Zn-dependent hydrolase [Planctomycetia bacterium]|jgi:glyoxylase-like metal-dependent hydrolase (beta-lactamase superfamily II)|nr:Zn-dependent hydrolase [Planctomycetia bacterium]